MPPTKANPIKEGSDEKKELIELFVSKEWTRMPGGRDDELEEMMKKYGWNKNQVSKHFGIWYRLGSNSNKNLNRSRDGIIKSLREKCDTAKELLDRTWETRDIQRAENEVNLLLESKEKMSDVSFWNQFMNDVFESVADNHASRGNGIPVSTRQYCRAIEVLKQDLWKSFTEDTKLPIRKSFFYLFSTAFVFEIQQSFAEPDIDEIENDVVQKIMRSKVSLPQAHAETLYFILGFVATACKKEGTRRKKKGFLFSLFADRHCLNKDGVEKSRELGSLPLQRMAGVDQGGLRYPTSHYYEIFVKVERIYCALLTEDNLFAFGPNALKRIHNKIATNKAIRTGLAGVLGKNANGSDDVIDYVLHTFGRVRGSDYARKLLARSGKSRAGATRTTLEVKSEEMKKKRAMATPPVEVGSNRKKQKNDMWENVVVEDEFAVDDSFLKECAERLDEFVESRLADEDRLVRNEMDTDSEDKDDSEIGSYATSEGENESE
jgi:hypothetical protein